MLAGGVRKIPMTTQGAAAGMGEARRQQPGLRVLLLHGGPGHPRILRVLRQLPSRRRHRVLLLRPARVRLSDQPDDAVTVGPRPLRRRGGAGPPALGLDARTSSCSATPGAASWRRSTRCSTKNLKGLVISNMMSSVPAYNAYAEQVLMPQMDQEELAEIRHSRRRARPRTRVQGAADAASLRPARAAHAGGAVARPGPRGFDHINQEIYVPMQGPASWVSADASSTGTGPPTWHDQRADPGHRRAATTPWTRRTWG